MGLTQKYKQQQQQARILTNESNYIRGMYYTDTPLTEGFVKVLLNFEIDAASGKLVPRKGLQTKCLVPPTITDKGLGRTGYNTITASKVCYTSDTEDPRKINKILQSIVYNPTTKQWVLLACSPEPAEDSTYTYTDMTAVTGADVYAAPDPFVIAQPEIHGQHTVHNEFFKKPVGTFAYTNSYYTFLTHSTAALVSLGNLPGEINGELVQTYDELCAQASEGTPGEYYVFVAGLSKGVIAYYDTQGTLQAWTGTLEALLQEKFPENTYTQLCYTKLGKDIDITNELVLNPPEQLEPNAYYVCAIQPTQNTPTEAATWGYNMLLEKPYEFACEETAVNLVTITGIIPYDKNGEPALTPKQNEEITLKGYYRAPREYHSDLQNGRYYATKYVELTKAELEAAIAEHSFGTWCLDNGVYYMVMPAGSLDDKKVDKFGDTKPGASVKLNVLPTGEENTIRVHWQMKSGGAAAWTTLSNEVFKLSDYYITHGDRAPFETTCTLAATEVSIKLTISDPLDTVSAEEYILSTQPIRISTVSDELSTAFNITPEKYNLNKCTGMCEWEQRLVLWGVPNALNMIFVSDVNNPGFFPYPNNVDILPDPIISVHNYGEELLVLTTTALYRLIWNAEGLGWTHKLVQRNLHIREEDTWLSCVYKNMFFFKSGEYYYMMVPKSTTASSIRGETTIAPISKNIENLLDNFHEIVYTLVKKISDMPNLEDFTQTLVNYFTYVDNTAIIINYVYDLDKRTDYTKEREENSKYLYVQLIYNTDLRTWSLRILEAAHMLYVSHTDVLQQDRFIDLTPIKDVEQSAIQFYEFKDLKDHTVQYLTDVPVYAEPVFKNYQYLNTGNREINTELKKRFREFQFKIKTNTTSDLKLYTAFYIDGSAQQDMQDYVASVVDTGTENVIVIDKLLQYHTLQDRGALKPTTLGSWTLNQSAFPGKTLWKVRMPISGKGYSPSAEILSREEKDFEILGHSWAYRTMNAR